jgi:hypothetical protein
MYLKTLEETNQYKGKALRLEEELAKLRAAHL